MHPVAGLDEHPGNLPADTAAHPHQGLVPSLDHRGALDDALHIGDLHRGPLQDPGDVPPGAALAGGQEGQPGQERDPQESRDHRATLPRPGQDLAIVTRSLTKSPRATRFTALGA